MTKRIINNEQMLKDGFLNYFCPGCNENTQNNIDIGWVECPLVPKNKICLGCCLDISNACETLDQDKVFKDIISEYSLELDLSHNLLTQTCLNHQIELIEKGIWDETNKNEKVSKLYDLIDRL